MPGMSALISAFLFKVIQEEQLENENRIDIELADLEQLKILIKRNTFGRRSEPYL